VIDREAELRRLMIAAQGGGREDAERLLRALAAPLRSFVNRQLRRGAGTPVDDAEDLVQDILVAVHFKKHSYDAGAPFTAWLYAVARYKIIDHWRKVGKDAPLALDDAHEVLAQDDIEPGLARRDLNVVLQHVPARTRQLIEATRIEGRSMAEAAAAAGMTETAAKVAVHRGLARLTALFKPGPAKSKSDPA
jgi:RNA polymerase sigma-70 factor, ECF subfamily